MIRDLAQARRGAARASCSSRPQTLGASTWQIVAARRAAADAAAAGRCVRLALGPAWLFLIAAEAIAGDRGLGYRIFLVRRYLAWT